MTPLIAVLLTLSVAADEPLAVRATRGQELVYRGQFTEESRGATVDQRVYDLEARTFVLEATPAGVEVAFQTILRAAGAAPDAAGSTRLELATVDARGRLTLHLTNKSPLVPLDGPPSLEPAGFIELPADPAKDWDAADGPRPPRRWQITGDDFAPGVRCLKLVGEQESAEWRRPTGNTPAWRRTEIVWLTVATGMVQRLERTLERRAGDGSAAYSSHTEYELKTVSTFPDGLAADCRREIQLAGDCNQKLAALLSRSGRIDLAALLDKIDRHTVKQSPTPYRPALVELRARVEAGIRGETPPPTDPPEPSALPAAVGRPSPDFLTTDLVSGASMRLARWHGTPVVLLFVRPNSSAASPTLNLAADLHKRYADRLHVAVLVVSDEERVRPAWVEFSVPVFGGRDVAASYGVVGPSRVVVLDGDGIVRHLGDVGPGVIDAVHRAVSGN